MASSRLKMKAMVSSLHFHATRNGYTSLSIFHQDLMSIASDIEVD